ncbi:hypothetical protein STEG23_006119, partial [Scotinomys teguina]
MQRSMAGHHVCVKLTKNYAFNCVFLPPTTYQNASHVGGIQQLTECSIHNISSHKQSTGNYFRFIVFVPMKKEKDPLGVGQDEVTAVEDIYLNLGIGELLTISSQTKISQSDF